jgi:hypothetical protein
MLYLLLVILTPARTTELERTLCERRALRVNPASDHDESTCG